MSAAILAVAAVILCILFRILNVNSTPFIPQLYCFDSEFLDSFHKIAPLLREPYIPTRLWGFSGHVQTIVHSIIGRVKCPWPIGERVYLLLPDGSTLTYDLYNPLNAVSEDDITIAICPGIGNSSESVYIRTFVHYAQCHGYRAAVLNHIGVLGSVQVTGERIFTYGHTGDFSEMVHSLSRKFPATQLVLLGFSMGGNLVTKYLGEKHTVRPEENIIGGISICQGYDAVKATKWLLTWQNFHRFYLYVLTENVKSIIMKHRHILLSDKVKSKFGLNERDIAKAATLYEIDEAYTRRVHNFNNVEELYSWSSSKHYFEDIGKPMVFINAKDDPLVHPELLEPVKKYTLSTPRTLFIELANGGHLGFYEGGLIYPNPVTWLDRALVSIIGGIVLAHNNGVKVPKLLKSQISI